MRVDKQNNYSKPYSLKHCSKIKAKKSREEECKYKITWQCVIEEEIEELDEALQAVIDLLENKVGVHE